MSEVSFGSTEIEVTWQILTSVWISTVEEIRGSFKLVDVTVMV